ncbi:MAG: DNA gyrase C-terminal beta-propeller domain-containing protein, partial [bacterium]
SNLRAANRGDLGLQILKFHNKTDHLARMVRAISGTEVVIVTNKERVVRIPVDSVPMLDRDAKGESVLQVNRDEVIISVFEVRS